MIIVWIHISQEGIAVECALPVYIDCMCFFNSHQMSGLVGIQCIVCNCHMGTPWEQTDWYNCKYYLPITSLWVVITLAITHLQCKIQDLARNKFSLTKVNQCVEEATRIRDISGEVIWLLVFYIIFSPLHNINGCRNKHDIKNSPAITFVCLRTLLKC